MHNVYNEDHEHLLMLNNVILYKAPIFHWDIELNINVKTFTCLKPNQAESTDRSPSGSDIGRDGSLAWPAFSKKITN